MISPHTLVRSLVMFLLLALPALAQFRGESQLPTSSQQVRITVAFSNGGPCDPSTNIALLNSGGIVAEGAVNDSCEVNFSSISPGTYRISVTGQTFDRSDTHTVEINSSGMNDVEVRVQRKAQLPPSKISPLVSASDLSVPASAKKEFDKAAELMARQNWTKAIEKLNHAIAIAPNYSTAYNDLGVAYGHIGDHEHQFSSFQKAISINEHCSPAYANLARMSIDSGDLPEAEKLLNHALEYEPNNVATLVLLSFVEFNNRHFNEVVATAHKAHALAENHAIVHWAAAVALEREPNRVTDRQSELKLYLQEAPSGAHASQALQMLTTLNAANSH
jgi:predicted Zn-dependent protease